MDIIWLLFRLLLWAILVCLVILVGLYFLDKKVLRNLLRLIFRKKKKKQEQQEESVPQENYSQLPFELQDIETLLRKYTQQIINENSKGRELNREEMEALFRDIAGLRRKIDEVDKKLDSIIIQKKEINKTPRKRTNVYFAKFIDSTNPLGFKVENLQEEQEGCCFKIILLSPNQAEYEIVDDPSIQQEMIKILPLIEASSEYAFIPSKIAGIKQIAKGELFLEGTMWKVVKKQIIQFQ